MEYRYGMSTKRHLNTGDVARSETLLTPEYGWRGSQHVNKSKQLKQFGRFIGKRSNLNLQNKLMLYEVILKPV